MTEAAIDAGLSATSMSRLANRSTAINRKAVGGSRHHNPSSTGSGAAAC